MKPNGANPALRGQRGSVPTRDAVYPGSLDCSGWTFPGSLRKLGHRQCIVIGVLKPGHLRTAGSLPNAVSILIKTIVAHELNPGFRQLSHSFLNVSHRPTEHCVADPGLAIHLLNAQLNPTNSEHKRKRIVSHKL